MADNNNEPTLADKAAAAVNDAGAKFEQAKNDLGQQMTDAKDSLAQQMDSAKASVSQTTNDARNYVADQIKGEKEPTLGEKVGAFTDSAVDKFSEMTGGKKD
mmetsp:Transcript_70644/g.204722  ORF Transcript_70644/g.204722 Transcript_70644/m.204722 type:complete len:102 (+) Transcript_70644:34-339(+)|eukprot:CAMPEP_0176128150 /NCGR_PEP_ID=MMETSP0120_2-20121206/64748_1 /TAXON_ID=160619 /ORGANISM="Kryptoperidinium foliaceum, Strain CCMP 1326" /LENGTH=101 /DNA_ID=CAMNT_0017463229 /DNA_START=27 /DNA_END=329 /DNA_ORIENTATION=-